LSELQKVRKGEPLRIPAETFNTFIDVAQAFRDRQQITGSRMQTGNEPAGIVLVRNKSDADQNRLAVMGVSTIIISPTDNLLAFQNRPAFDVVIPTASHASKFVILIEPIRKDRIGKAMIAGVTPVQLDVQSETDENAGAAAGVTATLKTGSTGSAKILWKESGTGTKWGVAQFPVGGAGGSPTTYARISARAGTSAPWLYSAEVVVRVGNTRTATGQTLSWNLRNLAEEGPSGTGGNPMEVGDIVAFWPDGDGYACERSPTKGTY